jgi:predicted phosphodiesterase
MRIYLASDIHVEFHKNTILPEFAVDAVVLAGDICPGDRMLDVAVEFQQHCQAPVIVVAGNHEYYGCDYPTQLKAFQQRAATLRDIHFLENAATVMGEVRFLGCTLWTNFELCGADRASVYKGFARQSIADFSVIRHDGRRFTMNNDAERIHRHSYEWLERELAKPFAGKTVVVTHFLPHREGIHTMHLQRGFDALVPYFTVDCSPLMQRYPIDVWMYGHTHNSVDLIVENGTRLVSNQRGYPQEPWAYTQFRPHKLIEI